eukprot:scaffold1764_cov236-Pinguiococcus_pyrenoidosus.AAC.8
MDSKQSLRTQADHRSLLTRRSERMEFREMGSKSVHLSIELVIQPVSMSLSGAATATRFPTCRMRESTGMKSLSPLSSMQTSYVSAIA